MYAHTVDLYIFKNWSEPVLKVLFGRPEQTYGGATFLHAVRRTNHAKFLFRYDAVLLMSRKAAWPTGLER